MGATARWNSPVPRIAARPIAPIGAGCRTRGRWRGGRLPPPVLQGGGRAPEERSEDVAGVGSEPEARVVPSARREALRPAVQMRATAQMRVAVQMRATAQARREARMRLAAQTRPAPAGPSTAGARAGPSGPRTPAQPESAQPGWAQREWAPPGSAQPGWAPPAHSAEAEAEAARRDRSSTWRAGAAAARSARVGAAAEPEVARAGESPPLPVRRPFRFRRPGRSRPSYTSAGTLGSRP